MTMLNMTIVMMIPNDVTLAGITTVVSDVHESKALALIVVTLLGIFRLVIGQSEN